MSIETDARQTAEEYTRRHIGGMQPVETVGDKVRAAFEAGAAWAREQDTREPKVEIVREEGKPARCKVWRDGVLLFDGRDYSADLENREPSDAEMEAAGRGLYENRVSLIEGEAERRSWPTWEGLEKTDADEWRDAGRAALLAAREVRNRG